MINEFRGDAAATVHTAEIVINDAIEGALYSLAFDGRTLSHRATEDDDEASIAQQLSTLVQSLPRVSVSYATDADRFTVRGQLPGVPIADNITASNPASSYVERIRPGVLPTAQEFLVSLPATTTGGTWTLTANFGAADETTANINHNDAPSTVATRLNNLTTPTAGDFTVSLESSAPRTYRIKVGGTLAGTNITLTANATALQGNASVEIATTQTTAANAHELQVIWISNMTPVESGGWSIFRFSADGGETFSEWTQKPLDAADTDAGVLTEIQSRMDSLYGAGICTASIHLRGSSDQLQAAIVLKFNDTATRDTIVAEYRDTELPDQAIVTSETLQTGGALTANEFQIVNESTTGSAPHTYTLDFDGQVTAAINAGSSPATITTRFEDLSNVAAGEVQIHGSPGLYIVEFQNGLGGADQPVLISGNETNTAVTVTTLLDGSPLLNEVQRIIVRADGGTFTYSHDGNGPSAALNHDADQATHQTRLESLASIGASGTSLTGAATPANPLYVEFIGSNAQTDMALITADVSNLTGGKKATVISAVTGTPGVNEQQMIHIDPTATDGTYTLSFQGQPTDDLDHDEPVANVATEFTAVSTVGAGNAIVDGTVSDMLVEFQNDLGEQPVELIQINQDNLTVSGQSAMTLINTEATGPEYWNNPANWSLQHVPQTAETAVLSSGRGNIRRGLVQACEWTPSGTDVVCVKKSHFVDGQILRLRTTDTLPTAQDSSGPVTLSTSTNYYVVGIDHRDGQTRIKISETDNGEPIEFTNAGSGTHRIGVQLQALQQYAAHSGQVGFPKRDSGGNWIDSERYLHIDFLDPTTEPNLEIGIGPGNGTPGFWIDAGPAHVEGRIIKTSAPSSGAAFHLLNHNQSNTDLMFIGGSSAIATEAGESTAVKRIISFSDAQLRLGNVDYTTLENYGDQVEFTKSMASGSVAQTRNR